ncbi:MAG: chromate transporter [Lachnospiraceae bacterium]|nr:chromate transporter [Lachnospiraceae bacterium]
MGKTKDLIFSMFRVGLIGFGGGNALIPILEQVAVDEQHLVNEDEYEEDMVVASITPGALPVEIAGGIGRRSIGRIGLLIGAVAMALPGVLLTLLISSVITMLSENVLLQIRYLAVGVTAFICCLLTEYIVASAKQYRRRKLPKQGIYVALIVFLLTCGKSLYRILGIDRNPVFSIATIHVFIVAFFLLFYLGNKPSKVGWAVGIAVSALYVMSISKMGISGSKFIRIATIILMIVLACYGLFRNGKGEASFDKSAFRRTVAEIGWIFLFTAVSAIAALLLTKESVTYLTNGFISSVMSFGGGDAYLTVADGLFVQTGLISENDFYGYLVPVVNILPGSILCKTLSGIGYFMGYSISGNVLSGMITASAGFFVSILASCGIFDLIGCFYGGLSDMYFIRGIRRWIRPIVSGLMVTVMLSLVWQSIKLGNERNLGVMPFLLMAVLYALDLFMLWRMKMKNGNVVFISAVCAFIAYNLM